MRLLGLKLETHFGIRESVSIAQRAEQRQISSIWIAEYRGPEAMVAMTALALGTRTLTIGSSIIPIYTRSGPVLAMAAASLAEIAPGRIILGLGTSTETIVNEWHGSQRRAPVTAIRENVGVLRQLLAGEKVTFAGETINVAGFKLSSSLVPRQQPQIFLAALGQKMLATAAAIADGVLLNAVPTSRLAETVRLILEAAADRPMRPTIACELRVLISSALPEKEVARDDQRRAFAIMGRALPYRRLFARSGFESIASELDAAWQNRDLPRASAAISNEMLDDLVAIGDQSAIEERLDMMFRSGVDLVILLPIIVSEAPTTAIDRLLTLRP